MWLENIFAHGHLWRGRTQIEYLSQKMAQQVWKKWIRLKGTPFASMICLTSSIVLKSWQTYKVEERTFGTPCTMKTIVAVLSLKEYESEVLKRKNSNNNNNNNQQAVKRKRWQIRPQKHIVPWRLLVVCRRQKWVTTALYRFKRPKANDCFRRSCDYLY